MTAISLILVLLGGLNIIHDDFKRRWISLAGIISVFAGSILLKSGEIGGVISAFIGNIVFLTILMAILHLYFYIKTGKRQKLFNRHIGTGDLLVMIALCSCYGLFNYVVFLVCACIAALGMWFVFNFLLKKSLIRIPLAGVMVAIHLVVLVTTIFLYPLNLLSDPAYITNL